LLLKRTVDGFGRKFLRAWHRVLEIVLFIRCTNGYFDNKKMAVRRFNTCILGIGTRARAFIANVSSILAQKLVQALAQARVPVPQRTSSV
jgi:hypothetical protein